MNGQKYLWRLGTGIYYAKLREGRDTFQLYDENKQLMAMMSKSDNRIVDELESRTTDGLRRSENERHSH